MTILGVDPGLRHTGWCVLGDAGVVAARGTIVPAGRGRIQPHEVLNIVLPELGRVVDRYQPSIGVVEQVAWYGSSKRITLPLSHVAGGIAGFLVGLGLSVYLLLASMRGDECARRGWTQHERDAYELASVAKRHQAALAAGDRSALPERSAAARRIITAGRAAHGAR
jgi:hypothetical protein